MNNIPPLIFSADVLRCLGKLISVALVLLTISACDSDDSVKVHAGSSAPADTSNGGSVIFVSSSSSSAAAIISSAGGVSSQASASARMRPGDSAQFFLETSDSGVHDICVDSPFASTSVDVLDASTLLVAKDGPGCFATELNPGTFEMIVVVGVD